MRQTSSVFQSVRPELGLGACLQRQVVNGEKLILGAQRRVRTHNVDFPPVTVERGEADKCVEILRPGVCRLVDLEHAVSEHVVKEPTEEKQCENVCKSERTQTEQPCSQRPHADGRRNTLDRSHAYE